MSYCVYIDHTHSQSTWCLYHNHVVKRVYFYTQMFFLEIADYFPYCVTCHSAPCCFMRSLWVAESQREVVCFCCSLWRWEAGSLKVEILMGDDKFMWLVKEWSSSKQTPRLLISSVNAQLWQTDFVLQRSDELYSCSCVVKFENVTSLLLKFWCAHRLYVSPAASYKLAKCTHSVLPYWTLGLPQ